MIDATILFEGMDMYTPWFPRQADMLRVTAECIAVNGAELKIELYTKSFDEFGDGMPVDENVSITLDSPGLQTAEWTTVANEEGVQQLLRFRLSFTEGTPSNKWILYRLLAPIWFNSVQAS